MFSRVLPIVLFGLLGAQTAMPQAAQDGAGGQQQYRLTGVMVSDTRRTALLNGRVVQEGSRIGGALIESIDQRQIRVRLGSEQRLIRVGQYFIGEALSQPTNQYVVVTRSKPGSTELTPARLASAPSLHNKHTVVDGDTLSAIALRHRPDGATIDQVMIALFDANPQAFDGNLNRLRAGAVLELPDGDVVRRVKPAVASAQVLAHQQQWRGDVTGTPIYVASNTDAAETRDSPTPDRTLGPVQAGDTLSEIAHTISVSRSDISTAQVMVALYEANPHAFGSSMNMLFEGAVLELPADSVLSARSDADANFVVQRHVQVWGRDPPEPPVSEVAVDTMTIAAVGLQAAGNYLRLRWSTDAIPH